MINKVMIEEIKTFGDLVNTIPHDNLNEFCSSIFKIIMSDQNDEHKDKD